MKDPMGGFGSISWKVDVSLNTSPRADANIKLELLGSHRIGSPWELVDQAAKSAWFEWLEHRGCQPDLIWDDGLVDSDDLFSWISPQAFEMLGHPCSTSK